MMHEVPPLMGHIFAMFDNRTIVDRPNRRHFLGVAYGLRAGVHSVAAGPALPVARRTRGAARRAHTPEWSAPAGIRWVVWANY